MRRQLEDFLFVGIKNHVVALDSRDGSELWRSKLKGADFTTVSWDGAELYAANSGEVYRLDPESGAILWHNEMKGMGLGVVSLARGGAEKRTSYENIAAQKKREASQAAGAG